MGEVVQHIPLARLRLALRDLQREAVICLAIANTGAKNQAPYSALDEIIRRLHHALKRQVTEDQTGDHDG